MCVFIKSKILGRVAASIATILCGLTVGVGAASAADGGRPSGVKQELLVASGDGWALYMDGSTSDQASPNAKNECGVVRCTLYFTRRETVRINNNINSAGGGIGGLVASCSLFGLIAGPPGVVVAAACGASAAVYGGFMLNAISNAARTKGCFAASYGAGGPLFYNNHSSKCKA